MSDSVRPHRRQPTRLPCPLDSPGKSTGVGCHFLLQCMKVKSESEVAQSCLTPSDPMNCSPPGPSVHGIFQARVLEWGAIAILHSKRFLCVFQLMESVECDSKLMYKCLPWLCIISSSWKPFLQVSLVTGLALSSVLCVPHLCFLPTF